MISVDEAFARILESITCGPASTMDAPTSAPFAGILAESIWADRDQPPFDRVAMDGIAVRYEGLSRYGIHGIQAAGARPLRITQPGQAIEVMTGAVLPDGCDTVIPFEHVKILDGFAEVKPECVVRAGQNIHRRGSDARAGAELLAPGAWLTPPQWALAATVGRPSLKVALGPSISVISTGDELVPVTSLPAPHQIRASNATAIKAALFDQGWHRVVSHLVDDGKDVLTRMLDREISQNDFVILTGAVSMGAYDHVPSCLKELGVVEIFHKVAQRPGKPLWFGRAPQGTLIWGLPGNPVSAVISLYRYILPALAKWSNPRWTWHPQWARLANDLTWVKGGSMTFFAPSQFRWHEAVFEAWPLHGTGSIGSGNVVDLAHADGFVELPMGANHHPAGTLVKAYQWSKR